MRCPRHLSIILQFITTERHLRDKRHFHRLLRGGDKGKDGKRKKKCESWLFQTYQFHVNGCWNVKIFTLPFSHKISPRLTNPLQPNAFLLCFFFPSYFFHNSLLNQDLVPGHDMANYLCYQLCHWQMHCIACKFHKVPHQRDLPVTKFIVFGKWWHRGSPLMWSSLILPLS